MKNKANTAFPSQTMDFKTERNESAGKKVHLKAC